MGKGSCIVLFVHIIIDYSHVFTVENERVGYVKTTCVREFLECLCVYVFIQLRSYPRGQIPGTDLRERAECGDPNVICIYKKPQSSVEMSFEQSKGISAGWTVAMNLRLFLDDLMTCPRMVLFQQMRRNSIVKLDRDPPSWASLNPLNGLDVGINTEDFLSIDMIASSLTTCVIGYTMLSRYLA